MDNRGGVGVALQLEESVKAHLCTVASPVIAAEGVDWTSSSRAAQVADGVAEKC